MATAPQIPPHVKANDRAAKVYREVIRFLKDAGDVAKIDGSAVAGFSIAAAEVADFEEMLGKQGYFIKDKNGSMRRHPATILRNQASDRMVQYSKLLGIDRHFREKGRERATSLGKPMDKFAKLRKVS